MATVLLKLTPVDPWPERKLPQTTFDRMVRTSMNQMSTMVTELNVFITRVNALATELANIQTSSQNAANSALASKNAAAASATAAANSASAANTSKNAAATSANNAKASETAANNSKNAAATSATNAANSATAAGNSATAASTSAGKASTSAGQAATSATNAATSANSAKASENAAATSANNAKASETAANNSKNAAATSATNAAASAAQVRADKGEIEERVEYFGRESARADNLLAEVQAAAAQAKQSAKSADLDSKIAVTAQKDATAERVRVEELAHSVERSEGRIDANLEEIYALAAQVEEDARNTDINSKIAVTAQKDATAERRYMDERLDAFYVRVSDADLALDTAQANLAEVKSDFLQVRLASRFVYVIQKDVVAERTRVEELADRTRDDAAFVEGTWEELGNDILSKGQEIEENRQKAQMAAELAVAAQKGATAERQYIEVLRTKENAALEAAISQVVTERGFAATLASYQEQLIILSDRLTQFELEKAKQQEI